jgi:hypothetical protein
MVILNRARHFLARMDGVELLQLRVVHSGVAFLKLNAKLSCLHAHSVLVFWLLRFTA